MKKKTSPFKNILFFLKYSYKINPKYFYFTFFRIIIAGVLPLIPILLMKELLNGLTSSKPLNYLGYLLIILISTYTLLKLSNDLLTISVNKELSITLYEFKERLGSSLSKISYELVEDPKIRKLSEMANESENISIIFECFNNIFINLVTALSLISIIIVEEPILILLLIIVIYIRLYIDRKNNKVWESWRPQFADTLMRSRYFLSLLTKIEYGKEVRVNNMDNIINSNIDQLEKEYIGITKGYNKILVKNKSIVDIALLIQEFIIYVVLGFRVISKSISIGAFSMILAGMTQFTSTTLSVLWSFAELKNRSLFIDELKYFLDKVNDLNDNREIINNENLNFDKGFKIEFKNVSFKYPESDGYIIDNLSLSINSSESISIVGHNGAGKTTFLKLLCGLYKPTEGNILINNIDIDKFSKDEIFSAVFQDFKLLPLSIKENVTLNHIDNKNILDYINKSDLEFIKDLNDLEKIVGRDFSEDGIDFSGGERQKIAICRALYKNSPVLILDEPTSWLDPIAEYNLYKNLKDILKSKCSFFVTHRLNSTKFSDKILVFDSGNIVECGSHSDLMKIDDGVYKSLFISQSSLYL